MTTCFWTSVLFKLVKKIIGMVFYITQKKGFAYTNCS